MNILFAVDGSEFTVKAARFLIDHIANFKDTPNLFLLYVKSPIPLGISASRARALLGDEAINNFYKEEAEAALSVAEDVLRQKNVAFNVEYKIGDASTEIARYAKSHKIDMIVMGSHGHGALGSIILGSVTSRVLATTTVPMLIVR